VKYSKNVNTGDTVNAVMANTDDGVRWKLLHLYPTGSIYQRIFNQLTKISHWLQTNADSNHFWAFWCKSRDSMANNCKMMVH